VKDFEGKVAVVTGAASGIGFAVAKASVARGMHVVLADVEQAALVSAEEFLRSRGASVVPVLADISKREDCENLKNRTLESFGAVNLLVNNAGVAAGTTVWESTLADWEWVMGVNLWGVILCCHTFLPIMLAQNSPGHVVNTASVAGLVPFMGCSPYHVTKHAVVALSENLYHSLSMTESQVKVSVLCPGFVRTRIMNSGRNRPAYLRGAESSDAEAVDEDAFWAEIEAEYTVISASEVAASVFDAIERDRFWVLTHGSEFGDAIKARWDSILTGKNPNVQTPSD
jgi:NAD(P)-dependent dehydrogenase (short-subunit alcohol dehydrogenase family)